MSPPDRENPATPTPPRGLGKALPHFPEWQRLNLVFFSLFFLVVACLLLAGIALDRYGLGQVAKFLHQQVENSTDELADQLLQLEPTMRSRYLTSINSRGALRPALLDKPLQVYYSRNETPKVPLDCLVPFVGEDGASLEACTALSSAPDARGFLYVVLRFKDEDLIPFDRRGRRGLADTDYLRLEVDYKGLPGARWMIGFVPYQIQTANVISEVIETAPGFQLEAYEVDSEWRFPHDARSSAAIRGSLVDVSGGTRVVFLRVDLKETRLTEGADSWPPKTAAYTATTTRYDVSANTPSAVSVVATLNSDIASIRAGGADQMQRWYQSPKLHERVLLTDDKGNRLWSFEPPSPTPSAYPAIERLRKVWLGAEDLGYERRVAGTNYTLNATIPARTAIMEWNRFVPGIAVGLLAIVTLVTLFYVLVRISVLKRVMRLARAARQTSEGNRRKLPYTKSFDEIGILSRAFARLLYEDRKRQRATRRHNEHEKHKLNVIAHHIRSPIQSLIILNPPETKAHLYLQRMSKAIEAVYGAEVPRQGIADLYGTAKPLDLDAHLTEVAGNAPLIGVSDVVYERTNDPVMVQVDSDSLDDALIQLLNNAKRFRTPGSAIRLVLQRQSVHALISIENQGPNIPPDRLESIFDFGVSFGRTTPANHGQGLFVARSFANRMGGTIVATNLPDGVRFSISIPLGFVPASQA